jgi:hypothetical protein
MSVVRRVVLTLACLAGLFAGSLAGAAVVLASGTTTSAGDQQYVDPLTGTGSSGTSHPSGSTGSGSSSSNSGSSSSPATSNTTLSQSTPSTLASGTASSSSSSGSGTATASSAHGSTLPFTGMNVWACIAIGVGLLATGLVLRRSVRVH